jgi:hypothetical protein
MFVLNPDPFLLPSYRICPFQTEDIARNNNLPDDDYAVNYFDNRFGKGNWQYTFNGREAIKLALESYGLDKNDLVTIITTSQNFYISSCVTSQIEAFCNWNREILPETKLILVNHEFGYPYPEMEKLVATALPIIEDCCTTFFSQDASRNLGKYGDFSIYSFPKFFPLQIGGLLVSNKNKITKASDIISETANYTQKVISCHLKNETGLLSKRKENFEYAAAKFAEAGFELRFKTEAGTVPSVLLLRNNSIVKDLNALKVFLYRHGIQNSVFYGEDAFFIPNHQNLEKEDIDYFLFCIKNLNA